MPESFYDRDFTDSTFWGVQFSRAKFRDADFSESSFFHVLMRNVVIDGEIDHVIINGVDVTDYVNQQDRWWPLRKNLSPTSVEVLVQTWDELTGEWDALLSRATTADPKVLDTSVNGEWSLIDTLRHLIFAMDKWFSLPILKEQSFNAVGLPNTESQDRPWPGLSSSVSVDFAHVLGERRLQQRKFSSFISTLRIEDLPPFVVIEENGQVPALVCFHVVLEEEFEHLRYAIRDLSALGVT